MKSIKHLIFAASMMFSASAFAQSSPPAVDDDCSTDADCPSGFACEIFGSADCAACPSGEECPPCVTETYGYCSPPPPAQCASDADCSGEDVCVTYSYESCTGGQGPIPCDPDGDCPTPEPTPEPECTSGTESYCVPRYVAPCNADTDCGEGFNCTNVEVCSCTTTSDSDSTTTPADDCACEPSGEQYCELVDVDCTVDSDCSGALTCQDFGPEVSPAIGIEPCPQDGPCETLPPEPNPDPAQKCAPEGYAGWASADTGGTDLLERATGQENLTAGDRIAWGQDDSDQKTTVDGCSTTQTPLSALPLLLLGLFGFIRRRG